jgi:hypothetical protein
MRQLIICFYGDSAAAGQECSTGKFLQLTWRGQAYLLFAPESVHRYHNQILGQFLTEHHIIHEWKGKHTLVAQDPALAVHGGGRFVVDRTRRTLTLSDNSHAYGRFQELGLADEIAAARHPWQGYRLHIA